MSTIPADPGGMRDYLPGRCLKFSAVPFSAKTRAPVSTACDFCFPGFPYPGEGKVLLLKEVEPMHSSLGGSSTPLASLRGTARPGGSQCASAYRRAARSCRHAGKRCARHGEAAYANICEHIQAYPSIFEDVPAYARTCEHVQSYLSVCSPHNAMWAFSSR